MDTHGSSNSNIKPVVFDSKFMIPNEIVDDVICRFLLNIPKEEKFDSIRVCFQIELAHWFFTDFYCGEGCSLSLAQLRGIPYNQFAYIMFQKTPHLRPRLPEIDKHLAAFRDYKMRVPTYGAVLMNHNLNKVILVQGFRNHWGFPKGKVNEVEDPVSCAIREVYEETGYDITPLINPDHYIESKVFERNDRLYLVRGVDLSYRFQAQTQFEIKNIKWFNIDELPEHKKDTSHAVARSGVPISNFYTIYPYIRRLKLWIADKLEGKNKIQNFKIRVENDTEFPMSASSIPSQQRSSNKAAHNQAQHLSQQQHPKAGKGVTPYQFQTHFLPPAGGAASTGTTGWQLFPVMNEQKPYVMNSNAIHELILNANSNQQQQHRQGQNFSSTTKGNSKNARRRLFSEESAVGESGNKIQHSKSIGNKQLAMVMQGSSLQSALTGGHSSKIIGQRSQAPLRHQFLNSPIWTDFSFDRERVYRAFFTPS